MWCQETAQSSFKAASLRSAESMRVKVTRTTTCAMTLTSQSQNILTWMKTNTHQNIRQGKECLFIKHIGNPKRLTNERINHQLLVWHPGGSS